MEKLFQREDIITFIEAELVITIPRVNQLPLVEVKISEINEFESIEKTNTENYFSKMIYIPKERKMFLTSKFLHADKTVQVSIINKIRDKYITPADWLTYQNEIRQEKLVKMERIVPGYTVSSTLFPVKPGKFVKNPIVDKSKINLNILNDSILKGELEMKKVKEQHQMMRTPKNKAKTLGKDFYFDFNIDSSSTPSSNHPSSHWISSSPSNLRKLDVISKNLIPDYHFLTDKKATDISKKQVDLLYNEFEKSESEQFQKDLSNLTPSNRSDVYDSSKKKDSNKIFASPISRDSKISRSSSSDDCFFNTFNVNGRNQTLLEAEFLRDKENLVDHAVVEGMPIGFIDILKSLEFLNSDLILEIQDQISDYINRKTKAKNMLRKTKTEFSLEIKEEEEDTEAEELEEDGEERLDDREDDIPFRKPLLILPKTSKPVSPSDEEYLISNNKDKKRILELSKTEDELMMEVSHPKQKLNSGGVIGGKKYYKGYFYGVYQYLFELEEMPRDGDCGFHALEISRTQLFEFLYGKVDDERIRLSCYLKSERKWQ